MNFLYGLEMNLVRNIIFERCDLYVDVFYQMFSVCMGLAKGALVFFGLFVLVQEGDINYGICGLL